MKDFLGKELSLDDEVVFTAPSYRMFAKGKIIAFTKTKVRVEYMNTWNYQAPGYKNEYLAEPSFLILSKKYTWPNVQHESHKSVRSSDASTFDFICDDCGATDDVTGGWGTLRKPCKGEQK